MIARTKTEIRKALKAAGKVGDHWFGATFDGECWVSNGYFVARLDSPAAADAFVDIGLAIDDSYRPSLDTALATRRQVIEEGSLLTPKVLDGTNLPLFAKMPDGRQLALKEKGIGVIALDQAQINAIEAIVGDQLTHWYGEDFRRPAIGAVAASGSTDAVAILMPVRLD